MNINVSSRLFKLFQGMQSARGSVLLFADADGATKFGDLDKLEKSLKEVLEGKLLFFTSRSLENHQYET